MLALLPFNAIEAWRFDDAALHEIAQDEACEADGGEQAEDDTDGQRDGEAADGACAEEHQHEGGDERGHVRVEDGDEGFLEAGIGGHTHGLAGAQLLTDALVDEHVGVDGHADGQEERGDNLQGDGGTNEDQRSGQKDGVEHERNDGDDAWSAIDAEQEQRQQHAADDGCLQALSDGIRPELSADGVLLDDLKIDWQRAAVQLDGQVGSFFAGGKAAGDRSLAVGDRLLDGWCADHLVVEDDGDGAI